MTDDLRLADYRPRQELRVHRDGAPERPGFPVIDAHNHLGQTPFSGAWATRDAAALEAALGRSGIAALVDLDGLQGDSLRREVARWAPLGGRVAVFAGLDYPMWATRPDFGDEEARRLRDAAAAGARGLKVWKTLGLRARDAGGGLVAVDDRRLGPVWATAGELGLPVTIHVADPIAFFRPLDATNERWEELRAHPDWQFWPTRPPGASANAPGFPPFDELIDQLAQVVARFPSTTFIGAHVGCAAEDLGRVGAMLADFPNWNVDIAARIAELGRQPRAARELIIRWRDRVLFGTDAPPDADAWQTHFRFLETDDESFPYDPDGGPGSQGRWAVHGLALPPGVLRAVYAGNARRLVFPGLPIAAVPHRTLHLLPAARWEAWRDGPADERYTPRRVRRRRLRPLHRWRRRDGRGRDSLLRRRSRALRRPDARPRRPRCSVALRRRGRPLPPRVRLAPARGGPGGRADRARCRRALRGGRDGDRPRSADPTLRLNGRDGRSSTRRPSCGGTPCAGVRWRRDNRRRVRGPAHPPSG